LCFFIQAISEPILLTGMKSPVVRQSQREQHEKHTLNTQVL